MKIKGAKSFFWGGRGDIKPVNIKVHGAGTMYIPLHCIQYMVQAQCIYHYTVYSTWCRHNVYTITLYTIRPTYLDRSLLGHQAPFSICGHVDYDTMQPGRWIGLLTFRKNMNEYVKSLHIMKFLVTFSSLLTLYQLSFGCCIQR